MNRDRPELADAVFEQVSQMGQGLEKEILMVECGSKKPEGCSKYQTHWFRDTPYRGRYFGFNRGLEFARELGGFDYYWFVVNDITFDEACDPLGEMIEVMEENPRIGLLGPGEPGANDYRGAEPKPGRRWHKAATVHGLAHLIRGEVIHSIGYMNPDFHYSQGAGSEYAYKLWKEDWWLAYSDVATIQHAGGSTYGKVVPISRHEYQRRANQFASRYLAQNYGENWDDLFASVLPSDIEENTFGWQKEVWAKKWKRNPKEICPWFWKMGSFAKGLLGLRRSG